MKGYLFLVLLFSNNLLALETDQYLAWGHEIKDSSVVINQHINSEVRDLLKSVNQEIKAGMLKESPSCSFIVKKVFHRFRPVLPRRLEHWIEINPKIDVYPEREINSFEFYKMSIYAAEVWPYYLPLTRTINMNNIYFGIDKFSHFFLYGLVYFNQYEKDLNAGLDEKQATLNAILKGISSENGIMGKYASAVFSYADLEANYQGFTFARNLCANHIEYSEISQKYKLVNEIDMRKYVNPNWDESYYNSAYFSYRFTAVKPYVKKYCSFLNDQWLLERRKRYANFLAVKGASLNYHYLKALSDFGLILNQQKQSLESLCTQGFN